MKTPFEDRGMFAFAVNTELDELFADFCPELLACDEFVDELIDIIQFEVDTVRGFTEEDLQGCIDNLEAELRKAKLKGGKR